MNLGPAEYVEGLRTLERSGLLCDLFWKRTAVQLGQTLKESLRSREDLLGCKRFRKVNQSEYRLVVETTERKCQPIGH
jgi:hypothetical protein